MEARPEVLPVRSHAPGISQVPPGPEQRIYRECSRSLSARLSKVLRDR